MLSSWRRIITMSPIGNSRRATMLTGAGPIGPQQPDQQAAGLSPVLVWKYGIGDSELSEGAACAPQDQRDVAVVLELDQLEDRHHALADLEIVEPRSQLSRASAAEVVEQVVAVGRRAQLAQPAEDHRGRRRDRDGAVKRLVVCGHVAIARKLEPPLRLGRAPGAGSLADHPASARGPVTAT